MDVSILTLIIALLLTAVCINVAFHYLKIPNIIGYIVVGIMLGPQVFGWIEHEPVRNIAEFGIVFLLFTVGLEFSLSKLVAMRSTMFGYGSLQVLLSILATFLVGLHFHMSIANALIVGGIVAISSTAIVLKQLTDQDELYTQHGHNAVGILLLQDLAVIPFLMLIPHMGMHLNTPISAAIFLAFLKGIAVIILILLLGQKILRPLLQKIAATQSIELFTLTVLLISLSIAWLTHIIGLSLSLGAFLAGIMLGETEFRHQINLEIRPFRDVLLGLFFITIGMQLNLQNIPETWPWVLLLLAALLIFKPILITTLGILLRHNLSTALRSGIVLAQGSEFSFVILLLAFQYQLLPPDYIQVILASLLISMILSPVLIRYNGFIAKKLCPRQYAPTESVMPDTHPIDCKHQHHAIICGYGRVGQNIAKLLRQQNYAYTVIDLEPHRTEEATLAGDDVIYGDASHHAILQAANLRSAKVVIICVNNHATAVKILHEVRQMSQSIPIIVRSYDDTHLSTLRQAGATEVVPEVQETSLILGSHVLLWMGTPAIQVLHLMEQTRHDNYELFSKIFTIDQSNPQHHEKQLHLVELPEDAFAIDKTLSELCLDDIQVHIVATKRKGVRALQAAPMMVLQAGDVLILFGNPESIEQAERYLLSGFIPH